jgi:SNF2 family DNA or RNA helicase
MFEYSLKHWFEEAQISPIPDWFAEIGIWHEKQQRWIKPRWSQVTGLNMAFVHQRFGVFDDMGTGKTMIAHAYAIWHAAHNNRPVCVMPPILMPQFENKLYETFPGIEKHIGTMLYQGTQKQREKLAQKLVADRGQLPLIICSPDIFRSEFPLFQGLECNVFIGDEAKYINNPLTKIRSAIDLFMGPYDKKAGIIMNGTPGNNDLRDLYGPISWLTPEAYRSRKHFDYKHVEYVEIQIRTNKPGEDEKKARVKVVDHFKNLEELYGNLYQRARRIEKEDAMDIEPCQVIDKTVRLSGKHKQRYDEFVTSKVMLFDDGTAISGEQTSTMRAIAMQAVMQPSILQVEETSTVIELCDELVEEINPVYHKILIAAYYQKTVEMLVERYKHLGALPVYGPNGPTKNFANKETFIHDEKCRVLVVNYESGGVGLDGLQDVCCYGIAVEPPVTPGQFKQYRDRLHRGGQLKKVLIYYIVALGTAFVKATQQMIEKGNAINAVVSREQLLRELQGETDETPTQAAA